MKALAALTLVLVTGCAARKPAPAHPPASPAVELVVPARCAKVTSALKLDSQGKILRKQKVTFETTCTEVQEVQPK